MIETMFVPEWAALAFGVVLVGALLLWGIFTGLVALTARVVEGIVSTLPSARWQRRADREDSATTRVILARFKTADTIVEEHEHLVAAPEREEWTAVVTSEAWRYWRDHPELTTLPEGFVEPLIDDFRLITAQRVEGGDDD